MERPAPARTDDRPPETTSSIPLVIEQLRSDAAVALKLSNYNLLTRLSQQLENMAAQLEAEDSDDLVLHGITNLASAASLSIAKPAKVSQGVMALQSGEAFLTGFASLVAPVARACDTPSCCFVSPGKRPHHMMCADCGLKGPSYRCAETGRMLWCSACAKAHHPGSIPRATAMCEDCGVHSALYGMEPPPGTVREGSSRRGPRKVRWCALCAKRSHPHAVELANAPRRQRARENRAHAVSAGIL
jgi:hypothetical protein